MPEIFLFLSKIPYVFSIEVLEYYSVAEKVKLYLLVCNMKALYDNE